MKEFYGSTLKAVFALFLTITSVTIASAQAPSCATGLQPINGGNLTSNKTPFTWTAPSGGATGYRIYIGTNGGGVTQPNNLVNGTALGSTSYAYAGTLNCGTTYYWQVVPYNNPGNISATGCAIQSFTITASGDPAVFPVGSWNAYCFSSTNWTNYRGYYTSTGQDFDSRTVWTSNNQSPSSATGGASTYQGCSVPVDNHSVSYKRKGFTSGTYTLNIVHDDACFIFLNGTQIYTRTGSTGTFINSVWTGNLDNDSEVEFRWLDTGGGSHGGITFVPIATPTLNPGVIAGGQILCSGNNPYPFTSTTPASGTCSAITYQWQQDVGCTGTFTDIVGAVAATYDVPAGITQTTCYRRAIIDVNCGRTDYTNTVTITVTAVQQGDPTVFPMDSWNGYVFDFATTGYTTANNNWTDYKGFYPINSLSFNTTTIYANNGNNPPSIAAGYAGCQLATATLTGTQIKRQGFPTGTYQIDFTTDDAGFLFINGILVYSRTTNGAVTNVWTGNLDASSTVDFRYKNNGGPGGGALTFTTVAPTISLTEGGIALNGPSTICPSNAVTPIVSTSDAASSCYLYYQWQVDSTGTGYLDVIGATSVAYTPASLSTSASYRRKVTDACGDVAYSNSVDINVGPSTVPDASVFGSNAWIAYVYNQQNYVPASLFGSYTDPGVSATDPSFNSMNSWSNISAPSLAATYTGCQVGVDGHSVSYKREGFPAGTYTLNVLNDDAAQLFVDGVVVYSRGSYTPTFINGVWTGVLGPTSKVEFRWTEGVGASHGAVTFLLVTTPGPLLGGTISNAKTQVCSGDTPTAFTSTALPSDGCAVVAYQWQLDTGSGYTDISGATNTTYAPLAQTVSTSYRRQVTDACAQIAYSNVFTINVATPTPPDPAIFGSNVWNVYTYNDVAFTQLRGSYVDNGFSASDASFDSRNKWGTTSTPSNAPGYTGCQTSLDQHGVIYKRQGFPTGIYRLDYNSDDAGSVYIDGVLVYTSVSWGTLVTNIWTGPLNASTTIEYRWADTGGGSSYGQLAIVSTSVTPLVAGTIANASSIVCSGDAPAPFTSTANASGGCYKNYQWQISTTSTSVGFTDIVGATAATYTPVAITVTSYYRRKVTDVCGNTLNSNAVTITVGVPSPPTLTWGNGQWNAFVYNGRNFTTLFGSYTENNVSSVNYSFDSRNSWATTSRPSLASTYSGCQVGDNTFSVSYRQTNFVTGTYQIDLEADDDAVLIINGVTQFTGTGICCAPRVNVWTGILNASSEVEIRYGENNGNAYCKATLTSTTPPALLPGTIGADQTICTGEVPATFTSVANATSGCAITYQWRRSTTSATGPWTNIGGNSSTLTLTPPGQTQTSYYVRNVTDACGRSASSNVITVTVDPKPNNAGAMTGLASVCSGQSGVVYSINPVANATSYAWVVPTGSVITSGDGTNSVTITFGATSGDVVVQPVNACGVGLTSKVTVNVTPSVPAAASAISGPASVCQAQFNVLYSVPAVPNAVSYIWTLPAGATFNSGATTNSPRITFGSTGGTISVTPTNTCGNALTSTTLDVSLIPTPGAAGAITGTGTVCPGQTGVAFSIAAVANATTYNWSLPAGSTITSGDGTRSIVVTFGSISGNVTVTPTNACGTGTSRSLLVSVVALGTTGTISGQNPVCQNSTSIQYTVPVVTGASTYNWTVPPGATITAGNGGRIIRVTFGTTSGNITVTPSNTCATGTTSTLPISVTNSIPSNAVSIVGNINPCRNETGVTYSTTAAGATNYNWTAPAGSVITSGAGTNTITVTIGSNSGNVIVTPTNVCGSASATTQAITVSPLPIAVAGTAISTCSTSGPVNITAGSNAINQSSVAWTSSGTGTFANANSLTLATYDPSPADIASGSVTLTLTVTGNGGCSSTTATATKTLTINPPPTAVAGSPITTCSSSGAVSITTGASATNQSSVLWSSSGTGSFSFGTSLTSATYNPSLADKAAGSVILTLTASGNTGCSSFPATSTKTFTITSAPTAAAGTAITTCSTSGAVDITAGSSATNQSGIVWTSNGTGTVANSTSLTLATYDPSPVDISAGSVILTLTATGNDGCSSTTVTSTKVFTINATPAITSTTPDTRCGVGTVNLSAASSVGTISWYSASSGGSSLHSGTTYSPSISSTTTYYVEATNGTCVSISRTAVTATIDNACVYTWTGTTSTAWNLASNWSSGNVPTSTNDVLIPSSVVSGRMPLVSSSSLAKSLNNAGTITFTGTGTLDVYGDLSNTGTITTVSGSTINMDGSTAQTITGVPSVHNLVINNSAGVSVASALSINRTLSLTSGALTTNNNVTINFDNGGNIGYNVSDAGSISGNVSGTRNLVAKTHYISTPFAGVTSGQINASTPIYNVSPAAWLLSTKNYTTQGWDLIKSYSTAITPGTGYSLGMFNASALSMTGTYTHGATYSSGSYDNTVPASMTRGMYFMMGNPYPSTLDWDNAGGWTKTNINDAIYFWNPTNSSVSSYVGGVGTNGATQYIPAMQSFLVKVPGGGGLSSLTVNNNARVLTNTSYFRTGSPELVRLEVKNATATSVDETVVRMDDIATADFDSDADASKIKGSLALYTKTTGGTEEYSINTLPMSGPEMLVPLNLKVAVNGLYTIECKEYSIAGYSMILEDKLTQTYTLMENSTIYTINANKTDSTNRFVLRFVAGLTTGVRTGNSTDLQISTYDNQMMLNVSGIQTSNATINVYDASGLNVETKTGESIAPGIQTKSMAGLPSGVYIVKIEIEGTTYVGKVVLK